MHSPLALRLRCFPLRLFVCVVLCVSPSVDLVSLWVAPSLLCHLSASGCVCCVCPSRSGCVVCRALSVCLRLFLSVCFVRCMCICACRGLGCCFWLSPPNRTPTQARAPGRNPGPDGICPHKHRPSRGVVSRALSWRADGGTVVAVPRRWLARPGSRMAELADRQAAT